MKWIISNERRPDKDGIYHAEDTTGLKTGCIFRGGHWHSDTGHPIAKWLDESQGEQGEFYKWVKASERLPELEDKKAKSRFVHVEMKRYDSKETYIVKRTAIYFPEHFKTIEWEDWEDYSEERFPYTENDKEKGCVWLRPGWYETIHCDNCDDYWSSPLNVVEWLCKLSSPPPEGQNDPVAFVKWIGCKFFYDDESELWETIPEGKTYDFNGQKQFRFTSEELYQLFKTQKDFIGDPDECTGAFEGQ